MKFNYLIVLTFICCFFQFCKNKNAADYSGNYIGEIRGQKLSMLLKSDEKSKVTGTIFDRNINYKIDGEVTSGKLEGLATDSVNKLEFKFDAIWKEDTMMWKMQMVKPQESKEIPIKFIKVFINKEEKANKQSRNNSTEPTKGVQNDQTKQTPSNTTDLYDAKVMGLWEIIRSDKMKGSGVFNDNKYLFFNANGSVSSLKKTLVPMEGYKWYTVTDSLYVTSRVDGKNYTDNIGKYNITSDNMKIEMGSNSINLKKMK